MPGMPSAPAVGTPLRGADHDRGLQALTASVAAIARPAPSVLRIHAELAGLQHPQPWQAPNLAFRLQLGAAFGDVSRVYTVREFDAERARFGFDVVLHDAPGPMLQWARAVRPGDQFALTGPRPHPRVPERGRPAALFLDQSGIPALYSLLRQWPAGLCGDAWIASDDPLPVAELPPRPGVTLHRLRVVHGDAAGSLPACARALPAPQERVVWGAGEREQMRTIRNYFCEEVGLARQDVAVAGYWKRGETSSAIDQRRRSSYARLLAGGGVLADFDDLAVDI
jgi:NADPH-dependent ferric siderophore reductase